MIDHSHCLNHCFRFIDNRVLFLYINSGGEPDQDYWLYSHCLLFKTFQAPTPLSQTNASFYKTNSALFFLCLWSLWCFLLFRFVWWYDAYVLNIYRWRTNHDEFIFSWSSSLVKPKVDVFISIFLFSVGWICHYKRWRVNTFDGWIHDNIKGLFIVLIIKA